jgi:hypothetical protein
MLSSLYVVIAAMVILSCIFSGKRQFENPTPTASPAESYNPESFWSNYHINGQIPIPRNGDTNFLEKFEYKLEYNSIQNNLVDGFDVYDFSYNLIIWGCILLLTLANAVIAIIEIVR